ncbi:MAG: YkgJ family cysteine cluster protein [Trichlorobacter sp.]|nr:YkgJ family cysteine cluster protein [Trichlorobacter sp.]
MSFWSGQRKKLQGLILDHPLDNDQKCSGCDAYCCRGFYSVELTGKEYHKLSSIGAKRLEFTLTGRYFLIIEFGCEFLQGNQCRIYHDRPDLCRRFTCTDI